MLNKTAKGHILLGESGAGKSTLINLLGGFFKPDDGRILFDGKAYHPSSPLEAFQAGIRVIHQELHPLSNPSVAENLLFEHLPRRYGLINYKQMNARATELGSCGYWRAADKAALWSR
ncbi:hypothetical protein A9Z06_06730 [Rhizobium sp. YK2]|nr:hypothetical protein A9Z06_06730 [Rhizobium sp. YK2]